MSYTRNLELGLSDSDGLLDITLECVASFDYQPAERGAREGGTGLALDPDVEESVELESLMVEIAGQSVNITKLLNKHQVRAIEDDELARIRYERGI